MTAQNTGYRSIWAYLNRTPHNLGNIEVRGVRTRYLEAGDSANPTLLLLHGTAGSLENFCANYETLSRDYHVLGIDMLGCGYTDKPDFDYKISDYAEHAADFLDAMGVDRASIIGVSLGSWVAASMALKHPRKVASIVALAPAGIVVDAEIEEKFAAEVRKKRGAAAADPTWESVTNAMGSLMLNEEDLIDDLVATRLAIYQQAEMKQAMSRLLAFSIGGDHLTDNEWRQLQQPILVMAAVDAPNMFLDNAYAIAKLAPHAELYEIGGCDHWPQFEQPERFHELTLDFLTRHFKNTNSY